MRVLDEVWSWIDGDAGDRVEVEELLPEALEGAAFLEKPTIRYMLKFWQNHAQRYRKVHQKRGCCKC